MKCLYNIVTSDNFFSLFVSRLSSEYDDTFVAHVSMWKRDRQTQLSNFISKVRHLVAKPTHETRYVRMYIENAWQVK